MVETLLEAEQEHYLDCPNADVPIRSAALLLDVILFSLALSGIHHLIETVKASIPLVVTSFALPQNAGVLALGVAYFSWLLKTAALVLYFVWSIMRFGGSPAKLLMGLRIVDAKSGEKLTYPRAFLREALGKPIGVLTLFGALTSLIRPDRKAAHDLLSGSVVKKVRGDT